jgi:DNA sulfur modification protein DndD
MLLRSISLRDWKAFENARFDFPPPTSQRNVVLIGGRNGFGKTTLFEALALGLFGREGIKMVGRAAAAADEERRAISYRDFMQRALNARARQQGRVTCHVGLTFEDDNGSPIVLERTWFFNEAGQLKIGEAGEQVRILEGPARAVTAPSPSEIDPDGWYRDYVSRTFLPSHLANFFLFDGEQASVYAERDMARQVSDGIEGLLGLSWLRELAKALRDYAQTRLNQLPKGASTATIERLQREIAEDESFLADAEARIGAIERELEEAGRERDQLTRELMGYAGGGNQAEKQELIEERNRQEVAFRDAEERLFRIVEDDLPFALAGVALRARVAERLRAEHERANWLAAKAQGEQRLGGTLTRLLARLSDVRPELNEKQRVSVTHAIEEELLALWHPPPPAAAPDERHGHLAGGQRDQTVERLAQAAQLGAQRLDELLRARSRASAAARRLAEEIEARSLTTPQLEEKRQRLNAVDTVIRALEKERGEKSGLITARRPQLDEKRRTLARVSKELDQSQRPVRQARRGQEVAEMLDDLVQEAWPMQRETVAREMTAAIRAMAHRNDFLNRVDIDAEGMVHLHSRDGRDLSELNLSAGEKQIFTQALFAAVAKASGMVFPLVIDTPLGRLDDEHRSNVLKHLTGRGGQIILLSTDTEIVGPYYAALKPRLIKAYRLENRREGDVGISWPVEGYFED